MTCRVVCFAIYMYICKSPAHSPAILFCEEDVMDLGSRSAVCVCVDKSASAQIRSSMLEYLELCDNKKHLRNFDLLFGSNSLRLRLYRAADTRHKLDPIC